MRDERALKEVIDNLARTLEHIQDKLKSAHVLNGGFDLLMEKISGIEQKEAIKSKQIDDIHNALYDPDKGLHARLSAKADDEVVTDLKVKVENKADEKVVEDLKLKVDELSRWKANFTKLTYAIAVPIVTTFLKLLYDFFALHVQFK